MQLYITLPQEVFTQDQVDKLLPPQHKDDLLIQLLVIVDRKRDGKEVLLDACKLLSKDRQSYWPDIYERIKQSKLIHN